MVQKDSIQIHFFEFKELDPAENYGQVYIRTDEIDKLYQSGWDKQINMPKAGHLQTKPRRQKEFRFLTRQLFADLWTKSVNGLHKYF